MQMYCPGTVYDLQVKEACWGDGRLCEGLITFGQLFWTFPPCVHAFHLCKPIVQVDGTHLYGRYQGTLLVAVTQDGNNNILPLAFALVGSECNDSWTFFLRNIRTHVCPQEGITVISDRHKSIKHALNTIGWVEPMGNHRYCIRHLVQNFQRQFSQHKDIVNLRKALTNAGIS